MEEHNPIPWKAIGVVFAVAIAFLPLGALFGFTDFGLGARAYAPQGWWRLGIYFAGYLFAFHLFVVWPTALWMVPAWQARPPWLRVLGVTLLTGLPLLSFGHYLGNFRGTADYVELVVSVWPAVLTGAAFFEVTRKPVLFTAVSGGLSFFFLFFLNDVLGPFAVWWHTFPEGRAYYWLRWLSAGAAPLAALFLFGSELFPRRAKARLRPWLPAHS